MEPQVARRNGRFGRSLLQSTLRRSQGVQTRAAEMLKLSYRSFRHLMKMYDD